MFAQTQKKIKLNEEFQKAIETGNVEMVKELFSEDKAEDDKPFLDYEMGVSSAIMMAAKAADWPMVEALYDLEADLDVKVMPHQWYLINECIKNAPDRVTKAIIDYANVNVQTRNGETPLMIAIKNKKGFIADYLLETSRVNTMLKNTQNENAAHYAAREGNHELFLKLAEKSMLLTVKNKDEQTPIDLLEDQAFKATFANLIDKENKEIEATNAAIKNLQLTEEENTTEITQVVSAEPVKKVSGLSTIKRKVS